MIGHEGEKPMLRIKLMAVILLFFLSINSLAQEVRGPLKPTVTTKNLTTEVQASLDLGNLNVEQTAITIAKDYPGEYNLNQVSKVYDALRKGWYYYSDPSYKDKFKNANRTLQDGKISNTIGVGDCDDFAILMASLLESLQGSTRIVFAYDQDTRLNHAYAEVYLGKKSDPQADELIGWLKDEYNQSEIPGQSVTNDEVWLNLDYNSTYPGGYNFGAGHKVAREVVWQSASRNSPKIVPIIDTMDSTSGWEMIGDEKGSAVSINSVPSPRGKAIQMDYDLNEGVWAGISRKVSGSILSQVWGLNLSYYGPDNKIAIQLILMYEDGTSFGYSLEPEVGNKWVGLEALFEDFTWLGDSTSFGSADHVLDPNKVEMLGIICRRGEKDLPATGRIVIDHIRGVMNIPLGSPWARAEEEREIVFAKELAVQSESTRSDPSRFIESVQLAIESLSHHVTFEGDLAIRRGLMLLPNPVSEMMHEDNVSSIAFSPDGRSLATESWGTASLWNVTTGKELIRSKHGYTEPSSIAFGPKGAMLANASGNTVYIWNLVSGEGITKIMLDCNVDSVTFSPDGTKLATACLDKTVRVWDVFSGRELSKMAHDSWVLIMVFSPDGSMIATSTGFITLNEQNTTTTVWNATTGIKLLGKTNVGDYLTAQSFNWNGTQLATASFSGTAIVWDISSGKELARMIHGFPIWEVAFSPDGKRLSTASEDKTARIWDVTSGQELTRMLHGNAVLHISFSPDGTKLATASMDNTSRIWDRYTGIEIARMQHYGSVTSVVFSPDGTRVATASHDKTARIWDIATGKELSNIELDRTGSPITFNSEKPLKIHATLYGESLTEIRDNNAVRALSFCPSGNCLATASLDGTARIWDVFSGKEQARMAHDSGIWSVAFSPDGTHLATASWDGTTRIWNASSGGEDIRLLCDDVMRYLTFSPDGTRLATASWDGVDVRVWDVSSGKEMAKMDHYDRVTSLAFNSDGSRLATASLDGTSAVWDVSSGNRLAELPHQDKVLSLTYSSDGAKIATASSDGTARIWDAISGNELIKQKHSSPVISVAFSPDGTKMATASWDGSARIWNTSSGSLLANLIHDNPEIHQIKPLNYIIILNEAPLRSVTFSPDGTLLATNCGDKTVGIWDISSGKEVSRIENADYVVAVAFSPDGTRLATATQWNTARIWSLSTEDLICDACNRLKCNLTSQEWQEKYCIKCTEFDAYPPG